MLQIHYMTDAGDYEGAEKVLESTDVGDIKNGYLRPIYREIKTIIRSMTYNEEAQMYLDYIALKDKITNHYVKEYFLFLVQFACRRKRKRVEENE